MSKAKSSIGLPESQIASIRMRLEKHRSISTINGCWEWTGFKNKWGYGKIKIIYANKQRAETVSRVSYSIYVGPLKNEDCVLHRCDNPACFNPDHLFLGSLADNMKDMAAKGRSTFGEKHPSARLTENDIMDIKHKRDGGISAALIAKEYGVSCGHVYAVASGKVWKHLTLVEAIAAARAGKEQQ